MKIWQYKLTNGVFLFLFYTQKRQNLACRKQDLFYAHWRRDFLKVRHRIFSRVTSSIQSCWVRTVISAVLILFSSPLQIQSSSLHAEILLFFSPTHLRLFLSFLHKQCLILLANNCLLLQKEVVSFFITALLMALTMSLLNFGSQSVLNWCYSAFLLPPA